MDAANKIRTAFERSEKALRLKPSIGLGTAITKVSLNEGLMCVAEEGRWRLCVDMSPKSGGDGAAPDPGVYGRTALGSCLAIGYKLWAAKLGVDLQRIDVVVEADYDAAGNYGVSDVAPGYLRVRYTVNVESDASEEDVLRVLDKADAHSPYRDVFARSQHLERAVLVSAPKR